jgi:hypothetical protein
MIVSLWNETLLLAGSTNMLGVGACTDAAGNPPQPACLLPPILVLLLLLLVHRAESLMHL